MVSDEQVTRLKEIGNWLKVNGNAIYNTRTTDQYKDLNIFFTKEKDGKLYAIVCLEENKLFPSEVSWMPNLPPKRFWDKIAHEWKESKMKKKENILPADLQRSRAYPALVFSFTVESVKN